LLYFNLFIDIKIVWVKKDFFVFFDLLLFLNIVNHFIFLSFIQKISFLLVVNNFRRLTLIHIMAREVVGRAYSFLTCIVAFFLRISHFLKFVYAFSALRSMIYISSFDFIVFQMNIFILFKINLKVSFRRLLVCKRWGAGFLHYIWNLWNKEIIQFYANFIFVSFILLEWGSYLVRWLMILVCLIILRTRNFVFEWISFILFTLFDSTLHGV
jgi:hypothetical protein